MTFKHILLTALIVGAVLSTQAPHRIQPLSQILTQIEQQHDFGKSLSALVQMTMHSHEPTGRLNAINTYLNQLKQSLTDIQTRDLLKCNDKSEHCSLEIRDLKAQVKNSAELLRDARSELDELINEESDKQRNLQSEQKSFEQVSDDRKKALTQQEEENVQFLLKKGDYDSLIIACEEGIKLMARMLHGEERDKVLKRASSNFLQLTEVKKKLISAHERMHEKQENYGIIEPIIAVLTSLTTKTELNYENVMKCIELIEDILKRLRQDNVILSHRHDQIIEDLNALIKVLNEQITSSTKIIEIYQQRLADIKARKDQLQAFITDQQQMDDSLNQGLTQTQTDCTNFLNQCNEDSTKRAAEQETIGKLIQYFQSQVVTTTEAVNAQAYSDKLSL